MSENVVQTNVRLPAELKRRLDADRKSNKQIVETAVKKELAGSDSDPSYPRDVSHPDAYCPHCEEILMPSEYSDKSVCHGCGEDDLWLSPVAFLRITGLWRAIREEAIQGYYTGSDA